MHAYFSILLKPENPKVFLEQKEIAFEGFFLFFSNP